MTDAASGRRNLLARPAISRSQFEHSIGVVRLEIDCPKTLSGDVTEGANALGNLVRGTQRLLTWDGFLLFLDISGSGGGATHSSS